MSLKAKKGKEMVNSKRKGNAGEREAAKELRRLGFASSRRGKQYKGTEDSPDILTGISGTHWEVKRYKEIGLVRRALEQADKEKADGDIPVGLLRRDGDTRWIVSFYLDDIEMFASRIFRNLLLQKIKPEEETNESSESRSIKE